MEKSKYYDGHIYVKGNAQEIFKTKELNTVRSAVSLLLFSEDISLKQARDSLRTIKIILDELIKEEENSND